MPRYPFECCCGHEQDEFRPVSAKDDPLECPNCQSSMIRAFSGCGLLMMKGMTDVRPQDLDPKTRQIILDNKRDIESKAEQIKSGEVSVRMSKDEPDWAKPRI
jgi:putative FmdB family regulatory protein